MRILVIGDLHCPAVHPQYMRFCKDLHKKWKCNKVVFIGDIADWVSVTFHAKNPNLPGPKDEYELALREVQKWYKLFPRADILIGNHDARVFRKAAAGDVPEFFLRDYAQIWETPKWNWVYEIEHDGVFYCHGTGRSGQYCAANKAKQEGRSCVLGHIHHTAGINWMFSGRQRFFGMSVGTGVDQDQLNFDYNKHSDKKSALSAGIVMDGHPYLEVMPCSKGEKYAK